MVVCYHDNLRVKSGRSSVGAWSNIGHFNIFFHPTDCDEVISTILGLYDYKSSGYDVLTNEVIKHAHDYIVDPLTYIINLSFNMGEVPDYIKIAKVIPIRKSGQKYVCISVNCFKKMTCA